MKLGSNIVPSGVDYNDNGGPVTAYERDLLLHAIEEGNVLQLQRRDVPFVQGELFLPIHEIIVRRDSVQQFTVAAKHYNENLFHYIVNMDDGATCTLSLDRGLHAFKRYTVR